MIKFSNKFKLVHAQKTSEKKNKWDRAKKKWDSRKFWTKIRTVPLKMRQLEGMQSHHLQYHQHH